MLINLNYKKIIFLLSPMLVFLIVVLPAWATTLAWQEVRNDNPKQLIFILRLITGHERENAWSGRVDFDSSQLKLQSISDAHSLVSLWLERPSVKSRGQINFSGITPGGFIGAGELFRLSFDLTGTSAPARNSLRLTDFEARLGDGSGQLTKTEILTQKTLIDDQSSFVDLAQDQTPPELFWQFTREQLISPDWQLLVTAFDKQSGVNYSALATASNYFGPFGNLAKLNSKLKWQKLTGLQTLSASELRRVIFLKTVDNAGNAKIIKLYPSRAYSFVFICIIIIGLVFFLFL